MEIISFSGGVCSSALVILNVLGQVEPPVHYGVFADTGGESPGTYENVARMREWAMARGRLEIVTVKNEPSLPEALRAGERPIPFHFPSGGLATRDCTKCWKVRPIKCWMRAKGAATATVQIAYSLDEYNRMRRSPVQWVFHRYPLIELGLTRNNLYKLFADNGLPVPPPSHCFFCPLQSVAEWRNLAAYNPKLFEEAAQIEEGLSVDEPIYLSGRLRPLRRAFAEDLSAVLMPGFVPSTDCQSGWCWL